MGAAPDGLYNDGLVQLGDSAPPGYPQTVIVTGTARSGTSMAARALVTAGVDMGTARDDVVFEDSTLSFALTGHGESLAAVVARRNLQAPIWGFKRPHLFATAGPEIADAFRNPRFVILFRDAVAVAKRNSISELFDPAAALRWAVEDTRLSLEFALKLKAPVLLVSYEKAVQKPQAFIERLVAFCGLIVPPAIRSRMVGSVEADRPEYVDTARRRYDGYIDGMLDGTVFGWCRQIGLDEPLMLEIQVGDGPPIKTRADVERPDLAAAGVAYLRHGFRLDISPFVRSGLERVHARVLHRQYELNNSGRMAKDLSAPP